MKSIVLTILQFKTVNFPLLPVLSIKHHLQINICPKLDMFQTNAYVRCGIYLLTQSTSMYHAPRVFPMNVHETSMKNIIMTCTWLGAGWVLFLGFFLENHLFLHLETKFSMKLVPNLQPKHNFVLNFVGRNLYWKKRNFFLYNFLKSI